MPPKLRADQLLHDSGLADTREKAKRLIMAGRVFHVQGEAESRIDKAGAQLPVDAVLRVEGGERFVSRGGYKLLTAIEHFRLDVTGFVCLDVGASTGGFTDCLLQHGATKVYAADVGYGLLDQKLRDDPRVVVLEKINMRLAPPDLLPEQVDIITIDVSFISLTKILPACLPFLKGAGRIVALIKPQFELGQGATDKGVVRKEKDRRRAVDMVVDFAVRELKLGFQGEAPSSIKGPKGNQEHLALFYKP